MADERGKMRKGSRTNHLDIVVALKLPITVGAIEMILNLMSLAVFHRRPGFFANGTLEFEMVECVHVLIASPLAPKPSGTAGAFKLGRPMACGTAMILPRSQTSREGLFTGPAHIVIFHNHFPTIGDGEDSSCLVCPMLLFSLLRGKDDSEAQWRAHGCR